MADRQGWVRMRDLFGLSVVPPESAAVIRRAVRRAVAAGDVSPRAPWQLVEMWAADYLADEHARARAEATGFEDAMVAFDEGRRLEV